MALVCVFLFGGVDGNNVLIPYDSAGYTQYAAVRTSGSGIQIAQSALLPIQSAYCVGPTPASQVNVVAAAVSVLAFA